MIRLPNFLRLSDGGGGNGAPSSNAGAPHAETVLSMSPKEMVGQDRASQKRDHVRID